MGSIPFPLKLHVPPDVIGILFSVIPPVIRMTIPPSFLTFQLAPLVIRVLGKLILLPNQLAFALTGPFRTIFLILYLRAWGK
jgi:hypothetical protein